MKYLKLYEDIDPFNEEDWDELDYFKDNNEFVDLVLDYDKNVINYKSGSEFVVKINREDWEDFTDDMKSNDVLRWTTYGINMDDLFDERRYKFVFIFILRGPHGYYSTFMWNAINYLKRKDYEEYYDYFKKEFVDV